jgi:hypothetical protein
MYVDHRNLSTRRRMLKKGEFFQLVSNLFCVVRSSVKMFLCSKLSRVEISRLFLPKNFAGLAQTYSF